MLRVILDLQIYRSSVAHEVFYSSKEVRVHIAPTALLLRISSSVRSAM